MGAEVVSYPLRNLALQVAIPLAAGLLYPATRAIMPPYVAAAAMALSSVSVVLSSLLLRRYRRPHIA
jgi:Cu+-exporting ATPase